MGVGCDEDRLPSYFTDSDRQIVTTVYGSPLQPGATRDAFVALGLVNP
ncbi:MAG TPA: hypothetical protein VJG90_01960 [Candidatus Nanoarchaeia archaeon]|nr:hypothetical protein [Candidatus Nanoarchaeia archaeon]